MNNETDNTTIFPVAFSATITICLIGIAIVLGWQAAVWSLFFLWSVMAVCMLGGIVWWAVRG